MIWWLVLVAALAVTIKAVSAIDPRRSDGFNALWILGGATAGTWAYVALRLATGGGY